MTGVVYRFELIPFGLFSGLFALLALIWLLSGFTSIVTLGVNLARQQSILPVSWLAAGMGLLVIMMVVSFLLQAKSYPIIHDISSDIDNPPEFVHAQSLRNKNDNSLNYDPAVGAKQKQAYPGLASFNTSLSFRDAFAKAQKVAKEQGWSIEYSDEERGSIEATARSYLLGFVDDVVIRVQQIDGGSVIDIRSVSRVGKSDLGANASRIREFLLEFN